MGSIENYNQLIAKLEGFRRKYYLNQLLRGSLLFVGSILALYLVLSISESELYFSSGVRRVMLIGFLASALTTLSLWIVRPILKLNHISRTISDEEAARVIGRHFAEVEDKLLNILQLKHQADTSSTTDLLLASIDQKARRISVVPFANAIHLSDNRKYLKYTLPPLAVLLFILLAAPNVLREGTKRLIHSGTEFEKPAPFQFHVVSGLSVVQFEDFDLTVKVSGQALPQEVFIQTNDYRTRLEKQSPSEFTYRFRSVQDDLTFRLSGSGFDSREYTLKVIPKPMIVGFDIHLDYPDYVGKKDETVRNIGDLVVPEGTVMQWRFNSRNTSRIDLGFEGERVSAKRMGEELFTAERQALKSSPYRIVVANEYLPKGDSIGYNLAVIPDLYPSIFVERFEDSTNRDYLYFLGDASDDYGLGKVEFRYRLDRPDAPAAEEFLKAPVRAVIQKNQARFTYTWDVAGMALKPGDKVEYYFIVWDNDGVHGPKSARTAPMTFEMPTEAEFEKMDREERDELKEDMKEAIQEAHQLSAELEDLKAKLLQKQELGWEDKKRIEDLMKRQEDLQKQVENIKNQLQQNHDQQRDFKEIDERIAEKQKKLEDLFEDVLSEEMKKLMEEMEKLLEELQKNQMMDQLEDFQFTDEQLEKELDRMLELFKQLEFEQKMTEAIEELKELAEEQEQLSEETEEMSKEESQESQEKQAEIDQKFEDLKKELKELEKMNSELEFPNALPNTDPQQQEISEEMKKAMEQLQDKQMQKAAGSQKNSSQKMEQLAEQLESMMASGEMEQTMLDMQATRQLLENLIRVSFDQEEVMHELDKVQINTPQYNKLVQQQHKIQQDAKMIEDSLQALSKRVMEISSFVNKEMAAINRSMDGALAMLADRRKAEARARQQYVMTGMNNLALMLDEVLQAMQQQMSMMMPGNQMCQKPGSGQTMSQMRQMQQQLNQQMENLKGEMKKGEGKGQGPGNMSKQLAELAAKQAALRKALEEYGKNNPDPDAEEKGGGNGDLDKLADEMEKTEEDLVNKRLTGELLERQKDILIRLLEAEKAERERETSPERESKTAEEISRELPPSLEEYLKKRQADIEWYKTVPPSLKPFYRKLVESYFDALD